jgi:hypothetical protein
MPENVCFEVYKTLKILNRMVWCRQLDIKLLEATFLKCADKGVRTCLLLFRSGRKKVKFTLEEALKAQRWSRGIALLFNVGSRWGCVVNATLRPLYSRESDPVPIVQETKWAPGTVWTDARNLTLTGIQSPDRPACSESLYRLRNPGRIISIKV